MDLKIQFLINKRKNTFLSNESFKHVAMLFDGSKIYSIGMNYDNTHAEMDAINKIKPLNKTKKKKIDILIIRYADFNDLANSKPCCFCIYYMITKLYEKNYIIRNIYYSMPQTIIKTTFIQIIIINQKDPHFSSFYRHKKSKNPMNKFFK